MTACKRYPSMICLWLASLGLWLAQGCAFAQQPETPEIVFSGTDAQPLATTAAQLGNAVAIYEYVRNRFEYSPYHGSRSGSVNTFMGQRGSDVDIASALIALLRSQNIPARYAVGTVRIPASQLTNWLGIGNLDVAVRVLKDQGIQGVALAADRGTVDFEHVWAEAFVHFDQYRGLATPASLDCSQSANAPRCTWIGLDASFKQKAYNGLDIDPYHALGFDYTGYYNAIKDSATDTLQRKDKNPLVILEEQIAAWLRTSNPGKTLEDVADAGQIIETHDGLLPASLPYLVAGTVRRYDSVALHDAAVPATEPKQWGKTLRAGVKFVFGGLTLQAGGSPILLAEVNTKRLTLATEFVAPGNVPNMVVRLGGEEKSRPLSGNGTVSGFVPAIGYPFTLTVSMDGAPDPTGGGNDRSISAEYPAIIGGYYLIATGGESSDWSQVHRAADQLLADNVNHPVVFNPADPGSNGQACDFASGMNCTPYADAAGNGWDSSDLPLLQDKPALDALTGGLLYAAATQYYAKLREQFERADRLMKTQTPIIGFLGVVSSVYDAEYIDGTAFSILPGGLLIDMKGITIGGSYRANETPLAYSNRQFEFLGHITSSLEHEIWQELTGYDAVSTVRGIQMALAGGASLINPKKNSTEDTLPGLYPGLGFSASVPSGFSYAPFSIFATAPAAWSHATSGASFDTFLGSVNSSTPTPQLNRASYTYNPYSGLYGWSDCINSQEDDLTANINAGHGGYYLSSYAFCDGSIHSGTLNQLKSQLQTFWTGTVIPSYIGQGFFNYFDRNQGFTTTGRVFRAYPPAANAYDTSTIVSLRDDLYLRDLTQYWVEYTLPSTLVNGPNNRFKVDIRRVYETPTGRLNALSFEIHNLGK